MYHLREGIRRAPYNSRASVSWEKERKTEERKRRSQLIDLMEKIWQEGGLGGAVSREAILPIPAKLLEMEIDTCQCAIG